MDPAPAVHSQQSPIPHEERGPHTGQGVCVWAGGEGWGAVGRNLVVAQERQEFSINDSIHIVISNDFFMQEKSPFYDLCHSSLCHITKDLS